MRIISWNTRLNYFLLHCQAAASSAAAFCKSMQHIFFYAFAFVCFCLLYFYFVCFAFVLFALLLFNLLLFCFLLFVAFSRFKQSFLPRKPLFLQRKCHLTKDRAAEILFNRYFCRIQSYFCRIHLKKISEKHLH